MLEDANSIFLVCMPSIHRTAVAASGVQSIRSWIYHLRPITFHIYDIMAKSREPIQRDCGPDGLENDHLIYCKICMKPSVVFTQTYPCRERGEKEWDRKPTATCHIFGVTSVLGDPLKVSASGRAVLVTAAGETLLFGESSWGKWLYGASARFFLRRHAS